MIKRYIIELTPRQFEVLAAATDNFHTYLHDAIRYDHNIGVSKKSIKQAIIVSHSLLSTFETELTQLPKKHYLNKDQVHA